MAAIKAACELEELQALKNLNIEQAVTAIMADDPEAAAVADDLTAALLEAKSGKFGRVTQFPMTATDTSTE